MKRCRGRGCGWHSPCVRHRPTHTHWGHLRPLPPGKPWTSAVYLRTALLPLRRKVRVWREKEGERVRETDRDMVFPDQEKVIELCGKVDCLEWGWVQIHHNPKQTKCEICIFLFHFTPLLWDLCVDEASESPWLAPCRVGRFITEFEKKWKRFSCLAR